MPKHDYDATRNDDGTGTPKWGIKDLYFEPNGTLYVKNSELADQIWADLKAAGSGTGARTGTLNVTTDAGAGHPTNLLCPCSGPIQ